MWLLIHAGLELILVSKRGPWGLLTPMILAMLDDDDRDDTDDDTKSPVVVFGRVNTLAPGAPFTNMD